MHKKTHRHLFGIYLITFLCYLKMFARTLLSIIGYIDLRQASRYCLEIIVEVQLSYWTSQIRFPLNEYLIKLGQGS